MRALLIGVLVAAGVATAAQGQALDGPLSAPGEPPAAALAQAKAKSKPRKARLAKTNPAKVNPAKAPAAAQDAAVPNAPPPARAAAPADAVDLGMKWNGNNDGAAQTRFQSGPDTSPGAGAEVGMKLHF